MTSKFTTEIQVRFADLDTYNHVNNVTFFAYLETARVSNFANIYSELTLQGMLMVVVSARCDYKNMIQLDDRVFVELWVARVGTTSYELEYEIHNGDGKVFANASTVMVSMDAVTGKLIPVPERIRQLA